MTTLTELQSLKRSELQALCKVRRSLHSRSRTRADANAQTHELRANGKTGILIQLLQKHYAASVLLRIHSTTSSTY